MVSQGRSAQLAGLGGAALGFRRARPGRTGPQAARHDVRVKPFGCTAQSRYAPPSGGTNDANSSTQRPPLSSASPARPPAPTGSPRFRQLDAPHRSAEYSIIKKVVKVTKYLSDSVARARTGLASRGKPL